MRYLANERMVSLDAADLAAAVQRPTGRLAPNAVVVASTAVGDRATLNALPPAALTLLDRTLELLIDPGTRLDVNIAIADESIRRFVFAPAGNDFAGNDSAGNDFAGIAHAQGGYDIGLWSAGELAFVIEGALASSAPIAPHGFAATVSPSAVVAFIAIVDAFRLGRMQSVVGHSYPPGSVSIDEVSERIADASAEDFRWPLCFLDKALHTPVAEVLEHTALVTALHELADGGLLQLTGADGSAPGLIALGGFADLIADAVIHDVAKVAITMTSQVGPHLESEILLLVRSARSLWLFAASPAQGAIADLTQDSLAALVHALLSRPTRVKPAWLPPPMPPPMPLASPHG